MTVLVEPATERLRLRQWRDGDLEPFAAMGLDPQVMEFFPSLLTPQASIELATRFRGRIETRGWGFWAVELRETGEFIGFIGMDVPDSPLPFQPCVEIGWRLAHAYWRRGYATEGARAALRAAFETIGLAEIVAYAVVGNSRSRAVMERIGMRDARFTFDHPNVREGSPLRAHCLYRVTLGEWAAGNG